MKGPDKSKSQTGIRMEVLVFSKIESLMRTQKLYLDSRLSIDMVSKAICTNRTYVSRAVCAHYRNFREYVNSLRIEHLIADIYARRCGLDKMRDPDIFARAYGFKSMRSMDRVLNREVGSTYARIIRKRDEVF